MLLRLFCPAVEDGKRACWYRFAALGDRLRVPQPGSQRVDGWSQCASDGWSDGKAIEEAGGRFQANQRHYSFLLGLALYRWRARQLVALDEETLEAASVFWIGNIPRLRLWPEGVGSRGTYLRTKLGIDSDFESDLLKRSSLGETLGVQRAAGGQFGVIRYRKGVEVEVGPEADLGAIWEWVFESPRDDVLFQSELAELADSLGSKRKRLESDAGLDAQEARNSELPKTIDECEFERAPQVSGTRSSVGDAEHVASPERDATVPESSPPDGDATADVVFAELGSAAGGSPRTHAEPTDADEADETITPEVPTSPVHDAAPQRSDEEIRTAAGTRPAELDPPLSHTAAREATGSPSKNQRAMVGAANHLLLMLLLGGGGGAALFVGATLFWKHYQADAKQLIRDMKAVDTDTCGGGIAPSPPRDATADALCQGGGRRACRTNYDRGHVLGECDEQGRMDGLWEVTLPNGSAFWSGAYRAGNRIGSWSMREHDCTTTGEYADGLRQGRWKECHAPSPYLRFMFSGVYQSGRREQGWEALENQNRVGTATYAGGRLEDVTIECANDVVAFVYMRDDKTVAKGADIIDLDGSQLLSLKYSSDPYVVEGDSVRSTKPESWWIAPAVRKAHPEEASKDKVITIAHSLCDKFTLDAPIWIPSTDGDALHMNDEPRPVKVLHAAPSASRTTSPSSL